MEPKPKFFEFESAPSRSDGQPNNQMETVDDRISLVVPQKTPSGYRLITLTNKANNLLGTATQVLEVYHLLYLSGKLNEKQKIQLFKLEIQAKELQDQLNRT
uniref:Uncharacterized protein n=1 Tax=Pithovirus LCPAC201 TaxID=2506591 RepID=A0A481Z4V2_9VIRU|nr:MAG: hypothetical protein LCPAC201_01950 [Pithovirus LCPAC201]